MGPLLEGIEHVHESDVSVIRRVVGAEVFVHITIRPIFGAHVIQMITGRELAPIFQDVLVSRFVSFQNSGAQSVQLLSGIALQ